MATANSMWCYARQTYCQCASGTQCQAMRVGDVPLANITWPTVPFAPWLTEQRVREIVREEIERALAARDGGEAGK
jgi:hypothetical protein